MLEERPRVEKELGALAEEFRYRVTVQRTSYIMWRARFEYENSRGNPDNIKVDINYLMRLPLFGVEHRDLPRVFDLDAANVPCLTVDDVYGGKLKALAVRGEPRDLFDAVQLFNGTVPHDPGRLRKAFLFYAHMDDAELSSVDLEHARSLTEKEYSERLYPVLRDGNRPTPAELADLVIPNIETMLHLDPDERRFGERLLAHAFEPELLFAGVDVSVDIRRHPAAERRRQHPRKTQQESDE